MNESDPRHGTRRGYYAHRRADQEACEECKRAAAAGEAMYERDRIMGRRRRVAPQGTQRRLQALSALGWTWGQIGEEIGSSRSAVEKLANVPHAYFYASTAARVAEVYDRLEMTVPDGWVAERTRKAARRKRYVPPLAWDDIDNDPAPVGLVDEFRGYDDVETVVVERLLLGERVQSTRAEKEEAMRRWLTDGGSEREMCIRMGWRPGRYSPKEVA